VLVAAGAYAVTHQATSGQEAARTIQLGMARAKAPPADAEASEDDGLIGGANEAGYRWAERCGLTMRADCPTYSKAFHDGCEEFIQDEAQPEP
jgi:hypothetical protein